jgi:hypothetical protein
LVPYFDGRNIKIIGMLKQHPCKYLDPKTDEISEKWMIMQNEVRKHLILLCQLNQEGKYGQNMNLV